MRLRLRLPHGDGAPPHTGPPPLANQRTAFPADGAPAGGGALANREPPLASPLAAGSAPEWPDERAAAARALPL